MTTAAPSALSSTSFLAAIADAPGDAPRMPLRGAVDLRAPRRYQADALAAYDDTELLLTAILPDARVAHVGASAVPGAYSRGGLDVLVAVPRGGLREAFGVLGEAGYTLRAGTLRADGGGVLDAPDAPVATTLHLAEAGSATDRALRHVRDRLRADAALLARANTLRIAAAAEGATAYARAKTTFFERLLREAGLR